MTPKEIVRTCPRDFDQNCPDGISPPGDFMSVDVTNKVISRYFDLTSGLALCFEASGGPTLPKGGVECPDWYPASNSKLLRGLNFVRTYPASGPRIRKFCPDQYLASTPIVRGPPQPGCGSRVQARIVSSRGKGASKKG